MANGASYRTQAEIVLVLFAESGIVYCAIWVCTFYAYVLNAHLPNVQIVIFVTRVFSAYPFYMLLVTNKKVANLTMFVNNLLAVGLIHIIVRIPLLLNSVVLNIYRL